MLFWFYLWLTKNCVKVYQQNIESAIMWYFDLSHHVIPDARPVFYLDMCGKAPSCIKPPTTHWGIFQWNIIVKCLWINVSLLYVCCVLNERSMCCGCVVDVLWMCCGCVVDMLWVNDGCVVVDEWWMFDGCVIWTGWMCDGCVTV